MKFAISATTLKWILWILLLFFTLKIGEVAAQSRLEAIRTWSQKDTTRIVFDLTQDVDYQVFTLDDPLRLVVDFANTWVEGDVASAARQEALFGNIRWGVRNQQDLRIVFDLKHPVIFSQFPLGPASGKLGSRVVVDLTQGREKQEDDAILAMLRQQKEVAQAMAGKPESPDPIADIIAQQQARADARQKQSTKVQAFNVSKLKNAKGRDIVIVIDPGHGGKDPGATGLHGTHEKDVVLQIARRVKTLFDQTPGFKAVLTRNTDIFIPLRARNGIARRHHADFFVSIHADAARNRTARGSSVFALSQHGASSETARWLAQSENSADLIGGIEGELPLADKDETLRSVLLDLSMTATVNASLTAGSDLLAQLGRENDLHKARVEQAGFVVLKSPDIPSLLVETGFISTPVEERLLKTPAHQQQLAEAIYRGITTYFNRHPPPGTRLAASLK